MNNAVVISCEPKASPRLPLAPLCARLDLWPLAAAPPRDALMPTLMEKVSALRAIFDIPSDVALPRAVERMNEMMGIAGAGALPAQVAMRSWRLLAWRCSRRAPPPRPPPGEL